MRMTTAEYRALKPQRRKFGNVPTEYNGRTYASKREAGWAAHWDQLKAAGQIRGWMPQVSLPVPGIKGRRMVLDFVVLELDGRVRWIDAKGMKPTPAWQLKREAVEQGYRIEIEVVEKAP